MVDDEAINAAKERKRKAQEAYTGYDDEEFEEGRIGVKADLLGKYDDSFTTGKVKTEVSHLPWCHIELTSGIPFRWTCRDQDCGRRGRDFDDGQCASIKSQAQLGLCE